MNACSVETQREARHAKKHLKLGIPRPVCTDCGVADIRCLSRLKPTATHCTPLRCYNCHRKRKRVSPEALLRKLKRFSDAGYTEPACIVCREADLRTLELDHLAGEANSVFVEPLCLNCHAIKSDAAEDEPMASLRLDDPNRPALVLQAAFEFGLAFILAAYGAALTTKEGEAARAVFFGLVAAVLVAWALWNLAAHEYLTNALGPGYDHAIPAVVPR